MKIQNILRGRDGVAVVDAADLMMEIPIKILSLEKGIDFQAHSEPVQVDTGVLFRGVVVETEGGKVLVSNGGLLMLVSERLLSGVSHEEGDVLYSHVREKPRRASKRGRSGVPGGK